MKLSESWKFSLEYNAEGFEVENDTIKNGAEVCVYQFDSQEFFY